MSIEVIVYLRDAELPSRDEWQQAIDAEGIDLQLDLFLPREFTGFLPTKLDGQDCGFEYFFDSVDHVENVDILAKIGDRNRSVSFVWHSNEIDGQVAMLAAAVLTKLVDGVFFDPQNGEFARGNEVFAIIKQGEQSEWNRKMQLAEQKWGHTTNRRCPKCNAPCPEYKNKCSVCSFVIGRA